MVVDIYFLLSLESNFLLNLCLKKNINIAKAPSKREEYDLVCSTPQLEKASYKNKTANTK